MKRLIKSMLRRMGYSIARIGPADAPASVPYEHEAAVRRGIDLVRGSTMLSEVRLARLFELVEHVQRQAIEGALVECGVWKGGAVGMMAYAGRLFGPPRELHLFDAFDDICEPDHEVDGERAVRWAGGPEKAQGRVRGIKGIYDYKGGHGTVDDCRRLLEQTLGYDARLIHFHEGWFQDTLPKVAPDLPPIAVLRIDADWYASTKICLELLYDHVSPGGVIIIDDYAAYDGCKKAVDEFLQARSPAVFLNYIDTECRYWFK